MEKTLKNHVRFMIHIPMTVEVAIFRLVSYMVTKVSEYPLVSIFSLEIQNLGRYFC
jgi:hypothetical protein